MARIDENVEAKQMDHLLKDYEVMAKRVTLKARETADRIIKERSLGTPNR